ncbi:hypothetical protein BGY98DRAFT_146548 [Russula aff. rugulosa BPL654]|nr:hypothetical protein BGY98DRAFT_146548 [Russula aff. rugulosa BPL654]
MQRHKKVARIILLILSVINFTLAAPVSARGTREVRVVDVAEDSDYRLELELGPHDRRSPMYLNLSPQPSLGSRDSNPPFPVASPPPTHNDWPLEEGLDATPEPDQQPTHDTDPSSHSTDPQTDDHDSASSSTHRGSSHSAGYDLSSPLHGNLNVDSNHPLSSAGPTDDQPPLDVEPLRWAYPSSGSGPPTDDQPPLDVEPLRWAYPSSGSVPSTDDQPPLDVEPLRWAYPLSGSGTSTDDQPPLDVEPLRWAHPSSGSGPSTFSGPVTSPGSSTTSGPSPSHPPSSAGPLQHESENGYNELFKGKFKRGIPSSRPVKAVQTELQGALDSRDHKHPDFNIFQFNHQGVVTKFLTPATSAIRRVIPRCGAHPHTASKATSNAEGKQCRAVLLV